MRSVTLATDTGGTFTDFVVDGPDGISFFKLPSTPLSPDKVLLRGAEDIHPDILVHGTTVGTNLVLERKGARVALVTNEGFGDIIEIARQRRPDLYRPVPPVLPLVPYNMRFEALGTKTDRRDVGKNAADRAIGLVRAAKAESVAICLLMDEGGRSLAGERLLVEAADRCGLVASGSQDVVAEYREYERMSTTVLDAYVKPVMSRYMDSLAKGLPGTDIFIMQSNGGIAGPSVIRSRPVTTLYSGPAGGVAATIHMGQLTGVKDLISFDMGGTSTDVSAIVGGRIGHTTEGSIEGFPIRVPMTDIVTVGAGGGSIVWFDDGGAMHVGPESAGANPGPVCYGLGGTRPTVTDCDLACGYLDESYFLGGKMHLFPERAVEAIDSTRTDRGLTRDRFASGAIEIIETNMANAVRMVTVARGLDPEGFTLVAFGGAGPVHGAKVAALLGIPRVLVPFASGVFSAYGLLVADARLEYARTKVLGLGKGHKGAAAARSGIKQVLRELARKAIVELKAQGLKGAELRATLDLRYIGQSYEVNVPLARLDVLGSDLGLGDATSDRTVTTAIARFHSTHRRLYGHSNRGEPVEVVNIRLSVIVSRSAGHHKKVRMGFRDGFDEALDGTGIGQRQGKVMRHAIFGGRAMAVVMHARASLAPGTKGKGPAIIIDAGSTTVVHPGMSFRVDGLRNILIDVGVQ